MEVLIFILLLFLAIAFAWTMYRALYVNKRSRKLTEEKFHLFEDIIGKLISGQTIEPERVLELAQNPSTRFNLFKILERFDQGSVFPRQYNTVEKSAERFLVNWLEFPTELSAAPDEIELADRINLPGLPDLEYLVFRFKSRRLTGQWMLGVVGPFGVDSKPFEIPQRIFSRFNATGTVSPLDEVRWVHTNIAVTDHSIH
jgi:hypothetical protein